MAHGYGNPRFGDAYGDDGKYRYRGTKRYCRRWERSELVDRGAGENVIELIEREKAPA